MIIFSFNVLILETQLEGLPVKAAYSMEKTKKEYSSSLGNPVIGHLFRLYGSELISGVSNRLAQRFIPT